MDRLKGFWVRITLAWAALVKAWRESGSKVTVEARPLEGGAFEVTITYRGNAGGDARRFWEAAQCLKGMVGVSGLFSHNGLNRGSF